VSARRRWGGFVGIIALGTSLLIGASSAAARVSGLSCLDCGDDGGGGSPTGPFLIQSGTPLSQHDSPNFEFGAGDYNTDGRADLYAIKRLNTGTGRVEVHVLDAGRAYGTFSIQWDTPISVADGENFDFVVGDYNRDGRADVYAIKRGNTGTGRVEVHVLDAARKFAAFALQWDTPISVLDGDNFDFAAGDVTGDGRADVLAVKRSETGTGFVEVHVLDAARSFAAFSLQTPTPVTLEDAANFGYTAGDHNADGRADLLAVKRRHSGTGSVEVHVLDGARNYTAFGYQVGTQFGLADAQNFDFVGGDYNRDGRADLIGVKRWSTGTGRVEAHVVDYRVSPRSLEDDADSFRAPSGNEAERRKERPGENRDRSGVVLFVHGFDPWGDPGSDCAGWNPMRSQLANWGWRRERLVTLAYYVEDRNCDHWVNHHGSHDVHDFDGGALEANNHVDNASGEPKGHGNDTDIAHLAYHFAWYVWDHYSKAGASEGQQPVHVVAHSMGGLVVRYALAQVQRRHPDFPYPLRIRNVVTLGTPHRGTTVAWANLIGSREAGQMQPNSSFIGWLSANARNPQPDQSGADWTNVATWWDNLVQPYDSAFGMRAEHKVVYYAPQYSHSELRRPPDVEIFSDLRDAGVYWRDRPSGWYAWRTAPRVLRWLDWALASSRW
jgi:hypothetical protein